MHNIQYFIKVSLHNGTVYIIVTILRETLNETSNSTARLVYSPYTTILPTICTSVQLQASPRIASRLILLTHSSPSFESKNKHYTKKQA